MNLGKKSFIAFQSAKIKPLRAVTLRAGTSLLSGWTCRTSVLLRRLFYTVTSIVARRSAYSLRTWAFRLSVQVQPFQIQRFVQPFLAGITLLRMSRYL